MKREIRTEPFVFRGTVSDAGYEWLKGLDGKPRLVPRQEAGKGYHTHEAPPILFREFATLAATREGIQWFAAIHGDLFGCYDPHQGVKRHDGTAAFGASFGTWSQEIGDMRVLVELWENIRYRQISALKRVVKWTDNRVAYVIKTPRRESRATLAHVDIPESGFSRFSPKDVVLPARCALRQEINLRLAEYPTVPSLAWTPEYHQRIIFRPPNLLSAMWLQFAQAVTGEFELKVCESCGRYFQVGPGGRRADSKTCGDACRARKFRNK